MSASTGDRSQPSTVRRTASTVALTVALTVGALLVLAILTTLRPGFERPWGDEPTYLAMIDSLVQDRDLRFDVADRSRTTANGGTPGLILQRLGDRVFYSKPVLYPLLAAPFAAIAGTAGLIVLNAGALGLSLLLAYGFLRRLGDPARAALTLATFTLTAALLNFVLWRMTESIEVALVLAGLVLVFARDRGTAQAGWLDRLLAAPLAPVVGAVLLGLAASLRYPNAALAAAPVVAAVWTRRPGRAVVLAIAALAGFAAVGLVASELTGAVNPYKADRASFGPATGAPIDDAGRAVEPFGEQSARSHVAWSPRREPLRVVFAGLYFLLGRHSSVLFYTPFALCLVWGALRDRDRIGLALLLAASVLALFYVGWMPEYYFGGGTTVGNRYFLPAYPALLVAQRHLPNLGRILWAWVIAAVVGGSALVSVASTRDIDPLSQSHASAGAFRRLPYETVVREIDGQRDRYWGGDFFRFVDPFAEVGETTFVLRSDRPATELVLARHLDAPVRFEVTSDNEGLILTYRDWAFHNEIPVPAGGGTIELRPTPAWRRHALWWSDVRYRILTMRLGLRTVDGQPARAELAYIGQSGQVWRHARVVLEATALPSQAVAGTVTEVTLKVRNSGRARWTNADPPIHLGYRMFAADGVQEGPRQWLGKEIAPGEVLEATLPVRWPEAPGRYQIQVDLVLEGEAWFADRLGEPLTGATVEVVAAAPGSSPASPGP